MNGYKSSKMTQGVKYIEVFMSQRYKGEQFKNLLKINQTTTARVLFLNSNFTTINFFLHILKHHVLQYVHRASCLQHSITTPSTRVSISLHHYFRDTHTHTEYYLTPTFQIYPLPLQISHVNKT